MLHFSPTARRQIELIRGEYNSAFPDDPPVLLFIGIGRFVPKQGAQGSETIGLGFFQRSEATNARLAAATESGGLRYLLVNPERERKRFVNALLNYSDERSFFLEPAE